jgi:hypothetical protein
MSESAVKTNRVRKVHHTGRMSQIGIYLGKQLRFFINENDWKVLPMAAIIAGLVGMVIRKRFWLNMEGDLIGAFAIACVAIWNGCFNSIQSVCRERGIIKREHRSGMHISSYVAAHMIYQFLLCVAQTAITMFVFRQLDVQIPRMGGGTVTNFAIADLGITFFLITYAADMMSLFLSSISRTTTGAMTLMPFILIFQLVFSGGVIPLPEWSRPLSNFTISNYGIKAIASISGYNELPMNAVWNTLSGMKGSEVGGTVSVGDIIDKLDSPFVEKKRDNVLIRSYSVGDLAQMLADPSMGLRDKQIGDTTLGAILEELQKDPDFSGEKVTAPVTVGDVVDMIKNNEVIRAYRDKTFSLKMTVGEMLDLLGEENVKNFVMRKTAEASRKPEYAKTISNIARNWVMLAVFIFAFAALATIVLEMIDKDKR